MFYLNTTVPGFKPCYSLEVIVTMSECLQSEKSCHCVWFWRCRKPPWPGSPLWSGPLEIPECTDRQADRQTGYRHIRHERDRQVEVWLHWTVWQQFSETERLASVVPAFFNQKKHYLADSTYFSCGIFFCCAIWRAHVSPQKTCGLMFPGLKFLGPIF